MQFAHLSDTHLGYRQYGIFEREKDYYNVFQDLVSSIIQERPDFVLHAGDLFEFSRPPTQALLEVQKGLIRLKEAKIPVYAIAGNHDIIMKKNALPPHLLFQELGLKIISPRTPFYEQDDIFIGGSPYISRYHADTLKEKLKLLEKESAGYNKRIMVLHQGIDKYLPYEYELELADIPEGFDYYALGHIHSRIVDDYGGGKMVYPGSTEIWKMDEVENYQKKGKGYYLVDTHGDSFQVDPVNIELPREFIKTGAEYLHLEGEIVKLQNYIHKLKSKPVLHLTVSGGNFSRAEAYQKLNDSLSEMVLSLRPNFQINELDAEKKMVDGPGLDIPTLLREHLKETDNKPLIDMGVVLFKEIAEGNMETAQKISQKFLEEYYDY
ncbi:exonuclease SbcCD subunit D [Methanobacterium movens]